MTVDELQVIITANTNELRKEISKTNQNISGLQKTANKGSSGVLSAFKSLKAGIVALGIGKVITDVIQSGINAGIDAIKVGMDAIESDSLFETSLGASADAVRSWSDEISNALGLNALSIRKNTGVIYNMTSSMGVAEDSALTMSKGISLLSEDMASFYNLDSEEAFNKLRAGLTGETEPLKALGILVDENTIKQVAYSEGIAENGAELTNQQKVLARYVAILKQTGNAQGDLARTINSPSNQLRQLKQQVTQLSLAFSNFLIPIVSAVLPYLTAFTRVITQALTGLASFFGLTNSGGADGLTSGLGNASSVAGDISDGLDSANKSAKKLKGTLAGFDEMNVLQDNSSDSTGASSGGGAIGGDTGYNLAEYDAHLEWIDSKTNKIAESIKGAIKTAWNSEPVQAFAGAVESYGRNLWNFWKTLGIDLGLNISTTWTNIKDNLSITLTNMSDLWTTFWTDVTNGIDTWAPPFTEAVAGVFNSIWTDAIDPALQIISTEWASFSQELADAWDKYGGDIVNNIGEFAVGVVEIFQSIWDNVIDPIITPFLNAFEEAWNGTLQDVVADVFDYVLRLVEFSLRIWNEFIQPIIMWLTKKLKPCFTVIGQYIGDTFDTIIGTVVAVVKGIIKYLNSILDFWESVFAGDFKKAGNDLKNAFTGLLDVVIGVFKGMINGFIDTLNGMIGGLNLIEFDMPDWVPVIGGKEFGLNIPKIPKLARGGIIDSPTYAMVGEAGKEAVMPLERNTGWIDQLADSIGEKVGGVAGNIQLVVKLGEEAIFNRFIEYGKAKAFETNGEVAFI